MLDVMRRKKGLTRIILSFVVVATAGTFGVALYGVWGGALSGTKQGAPNWIAVVDGEQIPAQIFRSRRENYIQALRNQMGTQSSDDTKLTAIAEQQALSDILSLCLARREAQSEGLRVTPDEVRDAILTTPGFQQGGRFIGFQRYKDFLRAQGLTAEQFESELAEGLAADKMRLAMTSLAQVTDSDLEKRYRDQIQRVDLDYALLPDASYESKREPTEAEIRKYYEANSKDYMTPEARKASYVLFDRESRVASVQVSEEEMHQAYDRDKDVRYTHPDQRRASHILFKVAQDATKAQKEAARKKAEAALARIKAGEDFAKVAKAVSEDPTTAPSGGDLGWFGKGKMVQQFDDAVFSLDPGKTSDIVETPFGFHIIKVTGERDAGTQPFDEVKDEIRRDLAVHKAQDEISKDADKFTSLLSGPGATFDSAAAQMKLDVKDTGFFSKGGPVGSMGRMPQVDDAVFSLAVGDMTPPVVISQGIAVFKLEEIRPPAPSPLKDVHDRVSSDLKKARARDKARAEAKIILARKGTLKERIGKRNLKIKDLPSVNRTQPMPPLTSTSKEAAFTAPVGSVLGPFESDDGLLLLEVKGKSPSTPEEQAEAKRKLKEQMLDEERKLLYRTFMSKLSRQADIQINRGLLQTGKKSQ